jgi:hypothetical protein
MDERPIEVGDRFTERDRRNLGRVVEVRAVEGGRAQVENEVHPNNPQALGRKTWIKFATLRSRFTRISR